MVLDKENTAGDWLLPGERLDDLIIGGRKIIQQEDQFCFSLDAILLAHFATLKTGAAAVDLGAGSGVIGLLLSARGARSVTGVEINPQMVDMANRSAAMNGLTGQVASRLGDLRRIKEILPGGQWELVVSNPPYRPVGGGFLNPNDQVAAARHEITATLADVVAAARYLVKYRGRFAMVHLPERLADIIAAMRDAEIEPKRLQMVYPRLGKKPNILLVEGIRGARPGMEILRPLLVYDENGAYSEDIQTLYPGGKNSNLGRENIGSQQ